MGKMKELDLELQEAQERSELRKERRKPPAVGSWLIACGSIYIIIGIALAVVVLVP